MPHKCIQLLVVLSVIFGGPVSMVLPDEALELRLVPYPKQVQASPELSICPAS